MKSIHRLYLLMFFMLFVIGISAQVQDTVWRVITHDDNQYFGVIVDKNQDSLFLKTEKLGVLHIALVDIKSSEKMMPSQKVEGEYWPQNHHSTRYFYSPNGFNLKKGEGYYQNNWVLFNQVSMGVTDEFTIGVGLMPLFLFGGEPFPVWMTTKLSLTNRMDGNLNFGIGALAGTVLGEGNSSFAIPFGVLTLGDENRNLTFAGGASIFSGGEKNAIFNISGMLRVSKKTYLITENYLFGEADLGLISFGGRTAWKHLALDYGGAIPICENCDIVVLPWLGISVPFGNKNALVPKH